jgi:hypothetical protein
MSILGVNVQTAGAGAEGERPARALRIEPGAKNLIGGLSGNSALPQ